MVKRRDLTAAVLVSWPLLAGLRAAQAAVNETDAAAGVRAALERGALAAVAQLGRSDGFLGNPRVRIPLPRFLAQPAQLLRATGQGRKVDELVTGMNRAAEAAVPQARSLFVSTIKAMSVDDALGIVRGGATSVTDFFAGKTREPLTRQFLPVVTRATEKLDLAEPYNALAGRAAAFGLVRGDQATVQHHVTARALDGLYLMVGDEERKIRADPLGSGSAILRKVFSR